MSIPCPAREAGRGIFLSEWLRHSTALMTSAMKRFDSLPARSRSAMSQKKKLFREDGDNRGILVLECINSFEFGTMWHILVLSSD